jgi:2-polyprenyl-6-methoxyphenol hydroxylase-like FAD-dependent oxidoreductase
MTHAPRALIVGGGIAGPAVSLFLQRGGIESEIFEAYPEPATIGGGFQIAPNGMRVLSALGLADQVRAAGVPSSDFAFRNHRGHVIGRIDVSSSGYGVTILRSAFHRILLDEIARRGVLIQYGKRLCGIEQAGDGVVAHFDDGGVERADMLLASDGVHSRTRALILPGNAAPRYTGVLGIGGFAESPAALPTDPQDAHQLNFTMGARLQFGYAAFSPPAPRWGWWTHLPLENELTRFELQAIPEDVMRDRVLAAFKGWHAPIEALVSSTGQILRTAIFDVPQLPTWHVGRVMLLGDAAHAMSPAGGQGASLALEDAMIVGQSLAQRSRSVPETFAEVEPMLRVRAERMVKQAAENDRRQLKELGPFGQWMRDRMFPLFVPVIAREFRRQYAALPPISAASVSVPRRAGASAPALQSLRRLKPARYGESKSL